MKTWRDLVDHVPVNFGSIWAKANDVMIVPATNTDGRDGNIAKVRERNRIDDRVVDVSGS